MAMKGFLFLYNNPVTRQLDYVCANMGPSPGIMTHNVFQTQRDAQTQAGHDDNLRYGHGDDVPNGTIDRPGIAQRSFPIGSYYHNLRIEPGNWFRVGFRYQAFKPVEIPVAGQTVVIPYEELERGDGYGFGYDRRWQVEPVQLKGALLASNNAPANIMAFLQRGPVHLVDGTAEIRPIEDKDRPGALAGWKVWFNNTCPHPPTIERTTGFIGTVVLVNAKGEGTKNAGLGLESMACPQGGWSAMQFIEFEGDYGATQHGVHATPGTHIRLGVRGHSTALARLPTLEQGAIRLDLSAFAEEASESRNDCFDTDELMLKVGEKKNFLEIYRDGRRVNDDLPDTIYRGQDAFTKAEFKDPPHVRVEWLDDHPELPEGGWRVRMESELPETDAIGPVGFSGRIFVEHDGEGYDDPTFLPAKAFTPSDREAEWLLPAHKKLAGKILRPGDGIFVDTGALGWRGEIRLPTRGKNVDTYASGDRLEKYWILRESDYKRGWLYPNVVLKGVEATNAVPFPAPRLSVATVDPSDACPSRGMDHPRGEQPSRGR